MNALARTFLALAAAAGMVLMASAQRPSAGSAPASGPADTSLRIGPLGGGGVPVAAPVLVRGRLPARPPSVLSEGEMLIDHTAALARDATGKWWTVKHRRTGVLYLLPCELLETVEDVHAKRPMAKFALSGRVYRYYNDYYMLLRRAAQVGRRPVRPPSPRPRTRPAATTRPVSSVPSTTSRPASKGASADDVARLLTRRPSKPIVPVARPITPSWEGSSVAPAGKPIKPGPGRMIINRLTRLHAPDEKGGWFTLAFEADNTRREPPMRLLPNTQLERMEALSRLGKASGVTFYVSAEIYAYRATNYVLLRTIRRRHPLDRF
jgi:hypothetical protein